MNSGSERSNVRFMICDGNGRSMAVGVSPLLIGSRRDADFVIESADVSRRHAEVFLAPQSEKVIVRDLKSRNGTYVNDRRITEQSVGNGQEFRCGSVTLKVQKDTQADHAVEATSGSAVVSRPSVKGRQIPPRLPPRIPEEVTSYKGRIEEGLRKRLERSGVEGNADDLRRRVERLIMDQMREISPPASVPRERIIKSILDDMLGHGPLEPYLTDPTVTEIMVTSENTMFIERNGRLEYAGDQFASRAQLMNVIERIVNRVNRKINESSPLVDARLPDGSRVNAIIPPLALEGPCLTIRKFREGGFSVDDLISYGSLSADMAEFLRICVKNRMNILISGGTGSGKTTLLNVMASFIPGDERIVIIEDTAELQLPQFHQVRLQTRPENIEGKGRISIRDLVINALRMRPDRIVVGECRGGEALDMIQAMNTGHDGSLTTAHANSPRDALRRLEVMCLMAGVDLPLRAIREQLVSAIQIVVQIARFSEGARKVIQISEVSGLQQDVITMQDIFKYHDRGVDVNGRRLGEHAATGIVPGFVDAFRERGIPVDLSMFKGGKQARDQRT